jgi:hypothetical protein
MLLTGVVIGAIEGYGVGLQDLVELIQTGDGVSRPDLPPRAAVEELAHQGKVDELLLLVAAQELLGMYRRVTAWNEAGHPGEPPITSSEMHKVHERGNGAEVCGCAPISAHIAETYRSFARWYFRMIEHKGID